MNDLNHTILGGYTAPKPVGTPEIQQPLGSACCFETGESASIEWGTDEKVLHIAVDHHHVRLPVALVERLLLWWEKPDATYDLLGESPTVFVYRTTVNAPRSGLHLAIQVYGGDRVLVAPEKLRALLNWAVSSW
jgi:hypothetical protein